MRRCPALRGSSAISTRICRPQLQCRPYASKAPATGQNNSSSDQADSSSNSADRRRPPSPPNNNEDSNSLFHDWDQAFQIDQDAKTIETAAGSLPLSPVMDPSFWARREQHTKRKPKHTASKPQSTFERQFAANAFAQALATPVRYDTMTRVRLPSFFLQDFHLVTHPETGQPWWVPRSLALENSNHDNNLKKNEEEGASSAAGESEGAKKKPSREKLLGPNAYGPARKDILAAVSRDKSGFYQQNRSLFGPSSSQYKIFGQKAVWRQDMDEFVLGLMRQHVEQDLLYLSRLCVEQGRYYIAKCFGWGDVQYKHKGAVLWFGDAPLAEDGTPAKEGGNPPGPFATYEFSDKEGAKTAVVVHNMPMLLGEETASRIRKEAGALQDGSIFMLAGRRTTELQLKLWKLQGYLSDYR
ncbi:esterase-like protein [Apiospora rasikravindrae]|uniref:Esterase-like protein n=1 Tax=Apiospora rasikravindrae TaxID=990691 RepID=A0ABR1SNK7_9PEZI